MIRLYRQNIWNFGGEGPAVHQILRRQGQAANEMVLDHL